MEHIIVYGSQYGSTRRYAEKLSEETGIPAVSYKDAPNLSGMKTIVYLGSLYAGGVLGLAKTLRNFSLQEGQKLLLVTVGLATPPSRKTSTISARLCKSSFLQSCLTGRCFFIFEAGSTIKSSLSVIER